MKKLLLVACAALLFGSANADEPRHYRWCMIAKAPYGDTVFFSEVFSVRAGTYAVGIQNSFSSYVTARHDEEVMSGARCMGPYTDRTQAEGELNDEIGDRKRHGKQVVLTLWRYRGN